MAPPVGAFGVGDGDACLDEALYWPEPVGPAVGALGAALGSSAGGEVYMDGCSAWLDYALPDGAIGGWYTGASEYSVAVEFRPAEASLTKGVAMILEISSDDALPQYQLFLKGGKLHSRQWGNNYVGWSGAANEPQYNEYFLDATLEAGTHYYLNLRYTAAGALGGAHLNGAAVTVQTVQAPLPILTSLTTWTAADNGRVAVGSVFSEVYYKTNDCASGFVGWLGAVALHSDGATRSEAMCSIAAKGIAPSAVVGTAPANAKENAFAVVLALEMLSQPGKTAYGLVNPGVAAETTPFLYATGDDAAATGVHAPLALPHWRPTRGRAAAGVNALSFGISTPDSSLVIASETGLAPLSATARVLFEARDECGTLCVTPDCMDDLDAGAASDPVDAGVAGPKHSLDWALADAPAVGPALLAFDVKYFPVDPESTTLAVGAHSWCAGVTTLVAVDRAGATVFSGDITYEAGPASAKRSTPGGLFKGNGVVARALTLYDAAFCATTYGLEPEAGASVSIDHGDVVQEGVIVVDAAEKACAVVPPLTSGPMVHNLLLGGGADADAAYAATGTPLDASPSGLGSTADWYCGSGAGYAAVHDFALKDDAWVRGAWTLDTWYYHVPADADLDALIIYKAQDEYNTVPVHNLGLCGTGTLSAELGTPGCEGAAFGFALKSGKPIAFVVGRVGESVESSLRELTWPAAMSPNHWYHLRLSFDGYETTFDVTDENGGRLGGADEPMELDGKHYFTPAVGAHPLVVGSKIEGVLQDVRVYTGEPLDCVVGGLPSDRALLSLTMQPLPDAPGGAVEPACDGLFDLAPHAHRVTLEAGFASGCAPAGAGVVGPAGVPVGLVASPTERFFPGDKLHNWLYEVRPVDECGVPMHIVAPLSDVAVGVVKPECPIPTADEFPADKITYPDGETWFGIDDIDDAPPLSSFAPAEVAPAPAADDKFGLRGAVVEFGLVEGSRVAFSTPDVGGGAAYAYASARHTLAMDLVAWYQFGAGFADTLNVADASLELTRRAATRADGAVSFVPGRVAERELEAFEAAMTDGEEPPPASAGAVSLGPFSVLDSPVLIGDLNAGSDPSWTMCFWLRAHGPATLYEEVAAARVRETLHVALVGPKESESPELLFASVNGARGCAIVRGEWQMVCAGRDGDRMVSYCDADVATGDWSAAPLTPHDGVMVGHIGPGVMEIDDLYVYDDIIDPCTAGKVYAADALVAGMRMNEFQALIAPPVSTAFAEASMPATGFTIFMEVGPESVDGPVMLYENFAADGDIAILVHIIGNELLVAAAANPAGGDYRINRVLAFDAATATATDGGLFVPKKIASVMLVFNPEGPVTVYVNGAATAINVLNHEFEFGKDFVSPTGGFVFGGKSSLSAARRRGRALLATLSQAAGKIVADVPTPSGEPYTESVEPYTGLIANLATAPEVITAEVAEVYATEGVPDFRDQPGGVSWTPTPKSEGIQEITRCTHDQAPVDVVDLPNRPDTTGFGQYGYGGYGYGGYGGYGYGGYGYGGARPPARPAPAPAPPIEEVDENCIEAVLGPQETAGDRRRRGLLAIVAAADAPPQFQLLDPADSLDATEEYLESLVTPDLTKTKLLGVTHAAGEFPTVVSGEVERWFLQIYNEFGDRIVAPLDLADDVKLNASAHHVAPELRPQYISSATDLGNGVIAITHVLSTMGFLLPRYAQHDFGKGYDDGDAQPNNKRLGFAPDDNDWGGQDDDSVVGDFVVHFNALSHAYAYDEQYNATLYNNTPLDASIHVDENAVTGDIQMEIGISVKGVEVSSGMYEVGGTWTYGPHSYITAEGKMMRPYRMPVLSVPAGTASFELDTIDLAMIPRLTGGPQQLDVSFRGANSVQGTKPLEDQDRRRLLAHHGGEGDDDEIPAEMLMPYSVYPHNFKHMPAVKGRYVDHGDGSYCLLFPTQGPGRGWLDVRVRGEPIASHVESELGASAYRVEAADKRAALVLEPKQQLVIVNSESSEMGMTALDTYAKAAKMQSGNGDVAIDMWIRIDEDSDLPYFDNGEVRWYPIASKGYVTPAWREQLPGVWGLAVARVPDRVEPDHDGEWTGRPYGAVQPPKFCVKFYAVGDVKEGVWEEVDSEPQALEAETWYHVVGSVKGRVLSLDIHSESGITQAAYQVTAYTGFEVAQSTGALVLGSATGELGIAIDELKVYNPGSFADDLSDAAERGLCPVDLSHSGLYLYMDFDATPCVSGVFEDRTRHAHWGALADSNGRLTYLSVDDEDDIPVPTLDDEHPAPSWSGVLSATDSLRLTELRKLPEMRGGRMAAIEADWLGEDGGHDKASPLGSYLLKVEAFDRCGDKLHVYDPPGDEEVHITDGDVLFPYATGGLTDEEHLRYVLTLEVAHTISDTCHAEHMHCEEGHEEHDHECVATMHDEVTYPVVWWSPVPMEVMPCALDCWVGVDHFLVSYTAPAHLLHGDMLRMSLDVRPDPVYDLPLQEVARAFVAVEHNFSPHEKFEEAPVSGELSYVVDPKVGGAVGLPVTFTVQALDMHGGPMRVGGDAFVMTVGRETAEDLDRPMLPSDIYSGVLAKDDVVDHGDGTYTISWTPEAGGCYCVDVALSTPRGLVPVHRGHMDVCVDPAPVCSVMHPATGAAACSDPGLVAHDDHLYLFCGALESAALAADDAVVGQREGDVVVQRLDVAADEWWHYQRGLEWSAPPAGNAPVRVVIDTAALIHGGKLRDDCADLVFKARGGAYGAVGDDLLAMWLEPMPGCNSDHTSVWLQLDGATDVVMLYGNPEWDGSDARTLEPGAVFVSWDDFEEGTGDDSADVLAAVGHKQALHIWEPAECTADHGDWETFAVVSEDGVHPTEGFRYPVYEDHYGYARDAGKHSLVVDADTHGGATARKMLDTRLDSYIVRAAFYDSDAPDMSHYISVDSQDCKWQPESGKTFHPYGAGLGVHTGALEKDYVSLFPVTSTHDGRCAGWHELEIISDGDDVWYSIDNQRVHYRHHGQTCCKDIDRIYLRGSGPGCGGHKGFSMWDNILVAKYDPEAKLTMGEEECVRPVNADVLAAGAANAGTPPPKRTSFAAIAYHEGSAYVYSPADREVYAYSFEDAEWKSMHTVGSLRPHGAGAGRDRQLRDFSLDAAEGGAKGKLYLYGGRTDAHGFVQGTLFVYDIAQACWHVVQMPDGPAGAVPVPGPRAGHAAIVRPGKGLYLFGGFGPRGALADTWVYHFKERRWAELTTLGPKPTARMGAAVAAVGDVAFLYGGASGEGEHHEDIWKYEFKYNSWGRVSDDAPHVTAAAAVAVDETLFFYGGEGGEIVEHLIRAYDAY